MITYMVPDEFSTLGKLQCAKSLQCAAARGPSHYAIRVCIYIKTVEKTKHIK